MQQQQQQQFVKRCDGLKEFLEMVKGDGRTERLPLLVNASENMKEIAECVGKWGKKEYLMAVCDENMLVSVHVMEDDVNSNGNGNSNSNGNGNSNGKDGRLQWVSEDGHKNYVYQTMPWKDFVNSIFQSLEQKPKKLFYLRSIGKNIRKDVSDIRESFPILANDFDFIKLLNGIINNENLFSSALRIGSPNLSVWTHYDVMDNILFQAVGHKRVLLWPPEDAENLYVIDSSSLVLNVDEPDLNKYPLFAKAREHQLEANLNPGDLIYIPSLWFHNTRNSPSEVSVNVNLFWKELNPEFYHRKDLYGNRDYIPAEKALVDIKAALQTLQASGLPADYINFYHCKIRAMLTTWNVTMASSQSSNESNNTTAANSNSNSNSNNSNSNQSDHHQKNLKKEKKEKQKSKQNE